MKPLNGFWLYVNLGFAFLWDFLGFVFFIINFIPAIQFVSLVGSVVLDIIAIMTDIAFCAMYYSSLTIYRINLKLYQATEITNVMRLSRNSRTTNPAQTKIQQALARNVQKASTYVFNKAGEYIMEFGWKRIVSLIMKSVTESIPFIGDLSPSWTIGAWLHIKNHRARAKEINDNNMKFQDSIDKWKTSLSLSGAVNNIRGFNRGQKSQPVGVNTKR